MRLEEERQEKKAQHGNTAGVTAIPAQPAGASRTAAATYSPSSPVRPAAQRCLWFVPRPPQPACRSIVVGRVPRTADRSLLMHQRLRMEP